MSDDSIRCPKCKTVFHGSEEEAQNIRTLGACAACLLVLKRRRKEIIAQAEQDYRAEQDAKFEAEYADDYWAGRRGER